MPVSPSQDAHDAVAQLAREHAGLIHSLGLRFCASPSDAEDLVQEVFINALKGWDGFEGRSDVKTWLYTIAARACMRLQRPRAGQPTRIASLDASPSLDVGDSSLSALDETLRREALQRTEIAVAGLDEEFRVPLVLKDMVGLSVADIASIMQIEEGTVKSRLHRARAKVRRAMENAVTVPEGEAPDLAQEACRVLGRASTDPALMARIERALSASA